MSVPYMVVSSSEVEYCRYIIVRFVFVCECVCLEFVDKRLGTAAFCNHAMTATNEVTVNSEPVFIITRVCLWIYFTQLKSSLLFFSVFLWHVSVLK